MEDILLHSDVSLQPAAREEKPVQWSPQGLTNTTAPQVRWGPGHCILYKLPGELPEVAAFWNHQPK